MDSADGGVWGGGVPFETCAEVWMGGGGRRSEDPLRVDFKGRAAFGLRELSSLRAPRMDMSGQLREICKELTHKL